MCTLEYARVNERKFPKEEKNIFAVFLLFCVRFCCEEISGKMFLCFISPKCFLSAIFLLLGKFNYGNNFPLNYFHTCPVCTFNVAFVIKVEKFFVQFFAILIYGHFIPIPMTNASAEKEILLSRNENCLSSVRWDTFPSIAQSQDEQSERN